MRIELFFFGSCSLGFSFLSVGHGFLAAYVATFALGSCGGFFAFAGSCGVYLLSLALFQTLSHSAADSVEDNLD